MKNYLKIVWAAFSVWLFNFALKQIENYVDTNGDGSWSKEEREDAMKRLKATFSKKKQLVLLLYFGQIGRPI